MSYTQSAVLGFAFVFTMGILGCADNPKPVSTMQNEKTVSGDAAQVQERGAPMQRSGYMNVPRVKGTFTPIPPRGGTMNFSCNTTSCSCQGDADCNNMFSSNVCGKSAVCDTGSGECSCLRHQ